MFRFKSLRLEDFRCFRAMNLHLEPDLTVLFAENGEGKSAILNALALGLAVFQPRNPPGLKLSSTSDPRMVAFPDQDDPQPAGLCRLEWCAEVGLSGPVEWSSSVHPNSGRRAQSYDQIYSAIEAARAPGERWPLFAWYGTERMSRGRSRKSQVVPRDRWEGYASSLDPTMDDGPLLEWLLEEILTDAERRRVGEPERYLVSAVLDTLVQATPGVARAWYDVRRRSPTFRLENGTIIPWKQLSDGYHVFLSLVADIARRAVILNSSIDAGDAPQKVEGVVLIDEIDLHLHPRWQRIVLTGLRKAFPRLQLVVTTHSPQVLSSAENRQVRRIKDGEIAMHPIFVEGRDTNAILRDWMNTDDRDEKGQGELRELYDAIDRGDRERALELHALLTAKWGSVDPELIRAGGFMEWEDEP